MTPSLVSWDVQHVIFKVLVFFMQVKILFRMHAGCGQIILPLGSLFHA